MIKMLFLVILAFAATKGLPNGFGNKRGVVDVTIITEKEATRLFEEFRANPDIPFNFPLDGCYARATAMARMAEEQKLEMGKIYAEGILRVKTKIKEMPEVVWGYHVAPTLWVQKDGKPTLMVFDPSMFDKPVTVAEWSDAMKTPGEPYGEVKKLYYGSRFQLGPKPLEDTKHSWRRQDLEISKMVLEMYSSIDIDDYFGIQRSLQPPTPRKQQLKQQEGVR